jgi:NADH-quinone oxidoreductase subunit C
MNELILARLHERLRPGAVVESTDARGELTVVLAPDVIAAACLLLRDEPDLAFTSLRDVCGADYNRPGDRFEVVYNMFSLRNKFRLRLKVRLSANDPHVATVTGVWPAANWAERETYDMYGIRFDGHPDLRRIYMPEEFDYYPLRKDFPLMGVPGSLSLPRK